MSSSEFSNGEDSSSHCSTPSRDCEPIEEDSKQESSDTESDPEVGNEKTRRLARLAFMKGKQEESESENLRN